MNKAKKENGVVIVEAAIIFPMIFFVIFIMYFAGNGFFQTCRFEHLAVKAALDGAAQCADPVLGQMKDGKLPGSPEAVDVQPYRYIIGGMKKIEDNISSALNSGKGRIGSGYFSTMEAQNFHAAVRFNNYFIASSFSVTVDYKIRIPLRMLGEKDYIYIDDSIVVDVAVGDCPEFIRNIDMVQDYLDKTGVTEEIAKAAAKAKEWFNIKK